MLRRLRQLRRLGIRQSIQDHSEILLIGSFISMLIIALSIVLVLFDFLPKLIGQPKNFPVKAQCQLHNVTFLDHYCLETFEPAEGGVYARWEACYIAQLDSTYVVDDKLDYSAQLATEGSCTFLYPESTNSRRLLSQTIKEFQTEQNYQCWVNPSLNECFLLNQDSSWNAFIASQTVLGVILLGNVIFIAYVYHQKRQFQEYPFANTA